ncbi:DEAD/DEAH box helicase family protein [Shewanella avicenniae]|uniref:DEAD/DEAH box helicase family protein n=1 Tax=Shewanella avicenniae TaxID=2814294 RepID=A0ABX7QQK2_9GAMM|nr:DEAD/DEAH box helicase family protein [Shewanella avicenniae]QSX33749.1 DEAD/DEAH box helicase family protein [Shewanella avicenniae]
MLRTWQAECATQAMEKYRSGGHHYFCQGTPGAGKTTLAAEVASRLIEAKMVDIVLCFSPSLTVADGIKKTFSHRLSRSFNGRLGCIGQSLTYQSLPFLSDEFWTELKSFRVFIVFDEIHHCCGNSISNTNAWGQQILSKIQRLATYTLAMSGTPWRTDSLPIVMAQYTNPEGELVVDYRYSLKQAIKDKVCRAPKIVLVDSKKLRLTSKHKEQQTFESINEFLKETNASYQSIIYNKKAMKHLLGLGCAKLTEIRKVSASSGGLVVAASVRHAHSIAKMLVEEYQQSVTIVTYLDDMPLAEIQRFREGITQWIISVGMVSEGTDIPRLQVCCHLSSIKTELYFRQVLGRILRVNNAPNQDAWLYTFAEPNLVAYSEEIQKDIPDSCLYSKINESLASNISTSPSSRTVTKGTMTEVDVMPNLKFGDFTSTTGRLALSEQLFDEVVLGEFRKRVISAFL